MSEPLSFDSGASWKEEPRAQVNLLFLQLIHLILYYPYPSKKHLISLFFYVFKSLQCVSAPCYKCFTIYRDRKLRLLQLILWLCGPQCKSMDLNAGQLLLYFSHKDLNWVIALLGSQLYLMVCTAEVEPADFNFLHSEAPFFWCFQTCFLGFYNTVVALTSIFIKTVCLLVVLTGLFFILPCTDSFINVDMRTITFDIPPQEVWQSSFPLQVS